MKKVMSIIAVAAFTATFVACGPSAEEKAKIEEAAKRMEDSIKAALESAAAAATAPVDSAAAAAPTETAAAAPAEEAHH